MLHRTLAASVLALGLLAPAAYAGDPACDEVNNRIADYGNKCEFNNSFNSSVSESNALFATSPDNMGPRRVGEYIDETPEETNQRSSQ